ncbi:MAG: prepilin-type N-terminal cleavage/methylation domain-containing protein [Planctomycetes bacterium]|nr:prepilin-type N-terminal cleavage/methylation domain-containing protein [Planctomycetota bacterium]
MNDASIHSETRPATRLAAQCAFTLIELLVVVAIIALLIAILLPSLQRATAISRMVVCRTQQRQVGIAFFMFAGEHRQILPGGVWWRWSALNPYEAQPWFGAEVGEKAHAVFGWNHTGLLAPYIGLDTPPGQSIPHQFTRLYRCPGLRDGVLNSGIGSNGFFDYSVPGTWAGAYLDQIRTTARVRDPKLGTWTNVPTPLMFEEDPANHINFVNVEMTTGNTDQLGIWHPDGMSNYACFDGSAAAVPFTESGANMYDWLVRTPHGSEVDLSSEPGYGYGSWRLR